ncbi:hypothetical protein DEA8626_00363 [Defluviimonas aquaemixtae]|uniref:CHAD domain-containing protein n=1 Tax=Albidovulum aquaemixtae TaxID=1542388 RepID=A0A2R8B2I7_9RHOB|nr:CHAD domain-containing protein [Defluviimonas aquaemixtae]SPH16849.1 hypothetical protein DEA8626_00363 [Defluviimonas aquaemixtae]
MALAFSEMDKSVTTAVRRIARERLEASLALIDKSSLDRPELVHELRKNVKKTRGLLRLARPDFNRFNRENTALRNAARIISGLRDADILALHFDSIAQRAGMPAKTVARIRAEVLPSSALDAPATSAEDLLKAHRAAIAEIAARVQLWKIGSKGFDALAGGLEHTWKAAQSAKTRAAAAPSGATLHRWRKRIKDHWYHARLLEPIWPEMMAHHVAVADTLGETLGDARDLALLAEALEPMAGAEKLRDLALADETALVRNAQRLSTLFLSEPARNLSRRWRGWWQITFG